jgi:hypothetical protein
MAKVSRRNALTTLVGMTATTALVAAPAASDAAEQLGSTMDPDTITSDKINHAATVAARVFSTEERNQALKELTGTRKNIIAVRTATKPQGKAPAFQFQVSAAAPLPAAGIRVKPKAYRRTKGSPDNKTLARATVGQLAKWLRDGKTTSVALTELAITRCETYGPRLLCIVNMRAAAARREAIIADEELAKGVDRGPLHGIPYENGKVVNTDGRVKENLYVVGWAKRGPSGVIGTNKSDAAAVIELLVSDLKSPKNAGDVADLLTHQLVVSQESWQKINEAEVAAGEAKGKPRVKSVARDELLKHAGL